MKLRLAVALTILAIGALSAWSARRFFPALNDPRPPLAKTAPFLAAASPPLARHVALIIVDGLRLDATRGLPAIEALRARGAGGRARSAFPTISKSNYVTLISGVTPRYSGARTNVGFRLHAVDSLFARARAAGRTASYVADKTRGIARLFGVEDAQVARWENGLRTLFARTLARSDLVVLLFMEVDEAGHADGGSSDAYREAVRVTDAHLAELVADFDFTRDTMVFTADHGHTDRGGHGGVGPEVEQVPLVLAGAGIRPGATAVEAKLVDVAPTVAALLGIPAPGHGRGRTLVEVLDVTPAQRDALLAADAQRIGHLDPILAAIDRNDVEHHRSSRTIRIPIAIAALGGLVAITVVLARRQRIRIDGPVILAASVFAALFYGLVFGFDRWRALPSVPASRDSLWYYSLHYSLLAIAVHVTVTARIARRAADRVATATGMALVGLCLTTAPALAAWALVGPSLATLLPSTELVLITPASCVAVTHYAVATALLLLLIGRPASDV